MGDNYCWSHGPRIGDEGRPVCFRERGHKGMHESHPGSGFVDVTWGGPDMPVAESVRGEFWTPDSLASDPTDLIRAADAYVQPNPRFRSLYAPGADLVRRLRDALAASEAEAEHLTQVFMQHAADLGRMEGERDEDRKERDAALALLDRERAALAEANATIERVKALADAWSASYGGSVAGLVLRRAIEEPAPEVSS